MVPRLMLIYSPPFERLYNKRNAQEPICLLSCVVEIVQISEQDNIETLLRLLIQYIAKIGYLVGNEKGERRFFSLDDGLFIRWRI